MATTDSPGDLTRRPHYHALIFGYDFPDRILLKKSKSGDLFTSELLTSVWGLGHALFLIWKRNKRSKVPKESIKLNKSLKRQTTV
jgi:hypothetical protein